MVPWAKCLLHKQEELASQPSRNDTFQIQRERACLKKILEASKYPAPSPDLHVCTAYTTHAERLVEMGVTAMSNTTKLCTEKW